MQATYHTSPSEYVRSWSVTCREVERHVGRQGQLCSYLVSPCHCYCFYRVASLIRALLARRAVILARYYSLFSLSMLGISSIYWLSSVLNAPYRAREVQNWAGHQRYQNLILKSSWQISCSFHLFTPLCFLDLLWSGGVAWYLSFICLPLSAVNLPLFDRLSLSAAALLTLLQR